MVRGFIREFKLNDSIISTSIKLLELESINLRFLKAEDVGYISKEIRDCKLKLKRYIHHKAENKLAIRL